MPLRTYIFNSVCIGSGFNDRICQLLDMLKHSGVGFEGYGSLEIRIQELWFNLGSTYVLQYEYDDFEHIKASVVV